MKLFWACPCSYTFMSLLEIFLHIYVVARIFLHICVVARNISCTLSLMPTLSDHWSLTSTRTNVSSVRYNKQLDILLFATDKNFGCTSTLAYYAAWCFSAFSFSSVLQNFPIDVKCNYCLVFLFLWWLDVLASPPPRWQLHQHERCPSLLRFQSPFSFFLFSSFSISQVLHQN